MREKFRELVKRKNRIHANLELIQWDLETKTPLKSRPYLSELVGELSMQDYALSTSDEFVNLVEELNKQKETLTEIEKREIELSMEEIEKKKKIPADEYEDYARLTSYNQTVWEEAKAKKDFSIVKEGLKKIFDYNKKFATYRRKDEKTLYDVLLNDYEKGMDTERLDVFFSELKKEIKPGSKVKIAAATFSMFAFQQLKEELETIEELKFIFTNPTFVTDETRVGYREYTIPKKEREQSIFGGRYELKLMNELTQKAIARECADWIRNKARFKSINIETDEMPNGMRIETDDDTVAVDQLKNFDRKELGYDSSLFKTTRHIYHAPLSLSYLDEFDSLWQDDEYFRDVTEELLVHYKETLTKEKDGKHFKIVRRFRTQEDYQIQFDGDNLDQVYEMLIKKMGKDQFQSKLDGNLKESVELTEQLEKLEKQAQRLKKQMYAEKSMRKQMEVKKGYQEVLKQIQELK